MTADHPHRVERGTNSVGGRVAAVAVTLSLCLLPWLLAADDPAPPQREANRQRLSGMTVTERKQLDENFRRYREMPPAERDRLRNLQREIDRDPELQAAFDEYQRWADSLSPVQRHELRQTQDPEAKRQLIDRFRRPPPDERPDERPEPNPSGRPPNGSPIAQMSSGRLRIFEKLFNGAVLPFGDRFGSGVPEMEAIVGVLENELPVEARKQLSSLDPYSRKVRVVRLTLEQHPLGPPHERLFGPPDGRLAEKARAALPEGQIQQMLSFRGPIPSEHRNGALAMVLMRGLMMETLRIIEDHQPRQDTLIAFEKTLPEAERNRLERLNREERGAELRQLYAKKEVAGLAELQQILGTTEMQRLTRQQPNGPRFGPGLPDVEDRRDRKGKLPSFEGNRRPREFDGPPPNRPDLKD